MPQHAVDLASSVTHDRRTNDYATSQLGPALPAGATILRGRMIDTRVGSWAHAMAHPARPCRQARPLLIIGGAVRKPTGAATLTGGRWTSRGDRRAGTATAAC